MSDDDSPTRGMTKTYVYVKDTDDELAFGYYKFVDEREDNDIVSCDSECPCTFDEMWDDDWIEIKREPTNFPIDVFRNRYLRDKKWLIHYLRNGNKEFENFVIDDVQPWNFINEKFLKSREECKDECCTYEHTADSNLKDEHYCEKEPSTDVEFGTLGAKIMFVEDDEELKLFDMFRDLILIKSLDGFERKFDRWVTF